MSTDAPQKVIHLNRYHHFTELMRDPTVDGRLLRYQSEYDRTTQTTFSLRPAVGKSDKLFFFFHGMDGDSGDVVVARDLVTRMGATVVSMGGRGPSWVSTAFISDAEQVIRTFSNDFENYYLIGVSMGATQALSLAGLLPDDLRQRILGLVALIPGSNLPAILTRSTNDRVRDTLRASVDGDLAVLQQRSPGQIIDQYKAGLPFVIFYRKDDTLLLADELEIFIECLRRKRHPVTTFSAPGEHEFTYTNFDYQETIGRLGRDSSEDTVPLLSTDQ